MKYSKISVASEDYEKVKEICKKNDQSFSKVFSQLATYLLENEALFFPNELEKKML